MVADVFEISSPVKNWLFENQIERENLLDAEQLATRLSVSTNTVRKWRFEDGIPCVKLGKRLVRYRFSEVVNWLQTQGD